MASNQESEHPKAAESQEATPIENQKEDWEVQRDHHKTLADNAFRCGGFKTAIDEYTKAIGVDPEMVVLYSNRSAAHLRNWESSKALKDARKCIDLDPKYVKGHSRLAAALHALKRHEQAEDSYRQVLNLDPGNKAAAKGAEECKRELEKNRAYDEQQQKTEKEKQKVEPEPEPQKEEDDLLGDFFADVEEITKKKSAEEMEENAPTNAIKNDRQALGTSQEQIERLLQTNYEWRNLNAFKVLQLPEKASEDDISRRYKALSLLLHPDKNGGSERAQLAYDQVQKAKNILNDPDRTKHTRMLIQEGKRQAHDIYNKSDRSEPLREIQEREVMKIFAHVEQKRRDVKERERKFEQRERQQQDDATEKERKSRQFDKQWRNESRVGKRIGNWRDFKKGKKKKP
jgi:tetratricopeptide (TPR) repeat protein